jgi:Tol biopolymer transport system component
MESNKKTTWIILFIAASFLVITTLAQSCASEKDKRNHLDYFTKVDGISISSGGDQLTFTGCGHKDYAGCTIYRYDRKDNVLYRYVHQDSLIQISNAKYWSDSNRFLFSIMPKSQDGKPLLDDIQIAVMNPDGTGLKQLTEGKGIKAAAMLSPDGKTLVYAKGTERTEGKTVASHFDYYARDLITGNETRITDLAFYEIGIPYFTPDGRNIIFNNGGPMKNPGIDDDHANEQFREEYQKKYYWNKIVQYPVNGSGINRLPEPWFIHGIGSRYPIVTADGSLFFEGTTRGIKYYRRYPNGEITQFTNEELAIGTNRYPFRISVDPTARWMAILYEELNNDKARSIAVFDVSNRECSQISVPASATNISVH